MARRRTTRAVAKKAEEGSSHLVRSEQWNGLRAGDPVEVAGLSGRGTVWSFRAHVLNRRNGSESIEVVGGSGGDRTVRSFDPERIFAPKGGGSRRSRRSAPRPSLADAPQLPFG